MRALVPLLICLVLAAPAASEVHMADMSNGGAAVVAGEMVDQTNLLRGAAFLSGGVMAIGDGGVGTPSGWADAAVTPPFSYKGTGFGAISSGGADWADNPNTIGSTSGVVGNVYRNANDATVMALLLDVPETHNCLSISFQFLSEEYPEYIGASYNDGFIAELDNHTWAMSGTTITAPDNFAKDPLGRIVSVNSPIGFAAANAAGSTYDGASGKIVAITPVTPGLHTLYLSVFDGGDPNYDSTVFVDNVHTSVADGSDPKCPASTTVDPDPDPEDPPGPPCEEPDAPPECFTIERPPEGKPYEHPFWPSPLAPVTWLSAASQERTEDRVIADSKLDTNEDADRDGIADTSDTCLGANGAGADLDRDGLGGDCDADDDGDGILDRLDACPLDPDQECGLDATATDVEKGADAARGTLSASPMPAPGQGAARVHEVPSQPDAPLLPFAALGAAVLLLVLVLGRRGRDHA